jgi:hypothetical protein
MTPEDATYFDDARTMFSSAGWRDFVEEIEKDIDLCSLDSANSAEEFWFQKGRLQALRSCANYERTTRNAEDSHDA